MSTLTSLLNAAGWAMLVGSLILAALRLVGLLVLGAPLQVCWLGILLFALVGLLLWGIAKLLARG